MSKSLESYIQEELSEQTVTNEADIDVTTLLDQLNEIADTQGKQNLAYGKIARGTLKNGILDLKAGEGTQVRLGYEQIEAIQSFGGITDISTRDRDGIALQLFSDEQQVDLELHDLNFSGNQVIIEAQELIMENVSITAVNTIRLSSPDMSAKGKNITLKCRGVVDINLPNGMESAYADAVKRSGATDVHYDMYYAPDDLRDLLDNNTEIKASDLSRIIPLPPQAKMVDIVIEYPDEDDSDADPLEYSLTKKGSVWTF